MSEPIVLIDRHAPGITVVTLNRPGKRNALSIDMIEQLTVAIATASADLTARVIVLAANGPSFCAGLDLHEATMEGMSEKSAHGLARMYEALGNSPLITIAAAQGAAMGGGAGLLAACDFVVAADDLKLAYPEVRRGLVAALVTCLLRRRVSDRCARELILLGNTFGAGQAVDMKLVNSVVRADQLRDAAMQLATAACVGAPGAIARSKRLLDELAARPLSAELQLALTYHTSARNSAEAAEGIAAFCGKREPKWGARGS